MEPRTPPPPTHVHVTLTVTLNRRLGWVIGGAAIGALQIPGLLLPLTHLILHAIHHL